ncbi:hypothetical protein FOVSG1_006502 [Fusarium oxysporum f. sp. vasinfectum]
MVRFEIPKSATRLEQVPPSDLDLRSDEEIIAQLKTYQPIISEKNVWAFWDKGIDYMYPSYQVTILNWVRKLGPSWTVRLLDLVEDSPNNVYTFIDKSFFPECFNNKTMDGRHIAQHQADFMRLPVLYLHGGVYMDVGNMLHTHLDPLFWDHISADDSPYEIAIWMICGQIKKAWGSFGNYMMAARKGCLFIKHWHEGYKELWRTQTNDVDSHKLLIMRDIGLADGIADWGMEDYVNEMSDYVAQMLIGDRTRNLVDVNTGWNGRDFFMNKAFMVEGIYNGILGAIGTEYNGYKQADLLTTRLDEPDLE